jgi:hypothetical protein
METATARAVCRLLFGALLVVPLGCDSSGVGRTYPVTGRITLNDKPFSAPVVAVLFKPDSSKGNTSSFEPVGIVDENGEFQVKTNGKEGAPPGWYKVIVAASDGKAVHARKPNDKKPVVRSLLPERYGTAATSKLSIEVVENPGPAAYDLKLTDP